MKPLIIIFLLIFPIAYGLENCKNVMTENDIPCYIISSTKYPNACNTYTVKFYNDIPSIIGEHLLTDYPGIDRCNATFNFTTKGTYLFNISNGGDSGSFYIESEDENMASFAIMALVMALTIAVFWVGLKFDFVNSHVWNLIIKRSIIMFGCLLILLNLTMANTMSNTYGVGVEHELLFLLQLMQWILYFGMVALFLSTIFSSISMMKIENRNKRMGEHGEEY